MTVPGDWRRPGTGEAFHLFWCERCRFGRLLPVPDEATVAPSYEVDDYYTHQAAGGGTAGAAPDRLTERLRVHCAWRRDGGIDLNAAWWGRHVGKARRRICDLGCGGGVMLGQLQALGHDVLGVEPDPRAREEAARRGLAVFPGTVESLPDAVRRQRFDVVLLSHVLEHCREPIEALRSAAQIAEPDGLLVVETPNNRAAGLRRAGAAWHWLDVPRHRNFFGPESLRRACAQAGLRVRATEFTGYTRQFAPDWIAVEQRIHDYFRQVGGRGWRGPARNSPWRAWRLLLETVFAPAGWKYDSVRVLAGRS